MPTEFRLSQHQGIPETEIVEVIVNGEFAGAIYPFENGIKIVSAHMSDAKVGEEFAGEVVEDDGSSGWPPIPAVFISFDPSPYTIADGRVVKLEDG
jgi:hypothetical protein